MAVMGQLQEGMLKGPLGDIFALRAAPKAGGKIAGRVVSTTSPDDESSDEMNSGNGDLVDDQRNWRLRNTSSSPG